MAAGLCIGLVALGLAYRGPLLDRFKPSTDTLTNESGESPLATPDASPSATNPTTGSLPVPGEPGATVKRNRLSRDGLRYSLWGDVQDHGCDGEVLRECALLAAPDGQGVVLVQSFRSQWDEDSDVQLTALGMLLVSEMAAAKGAPEPTDGALVDIGDKSVYTATTFPSNLEVHNSVMIGNGWVVLVQSIAPSGVTSSYDDVVRSVRFPG